MYPYQSTDMRTHTEHMSHAVQAETTGEVSLVYTVEIVLSITCVCEVDWIFPGAHNEKRYGERRSANLP